MGDEDGTNRREICRIHPGRRAIRNFLEPSDVVNDKIISAFRNVKSFPLDRIIMQFWRPAKTTAGVRLLLCSKTPAALSPINHLLIKYRKRCNEFYYSIDDRSYVLSPMIISGAPHSRVFQSHFPEVVMDLRVHQGTPLVDLALECELTCSMMLPVFYETRCVGVVEVSMRPPGLLEIFNKLNGELKWVGFSIYDVQGCRPRKSLSNGVVHAKREILEALKMARQQHAIILGQVWIPYESGNCQQRTILHRFSSCFANVHGWSLLWDFYNNVAVHPLKTGEGLVGRTLENHQAHLCRNINKLNEDRGVLAVLSANMRCTCFVICLRSSETGEVDYAFEFFWSLSCNHLSLLEGLLLTLKEYLPSFKFASGEQLGDEISVLDVENPSSAPIKILPGNEPKALDKTRTFVGVKRKSIEGQENEYPLIYPNDPKDELVIYAVYKINYRLFFLPSSPTFESVMKRISQEFNLNPSGPYKVEYQVLPGKWYNLTDDTTLQSCISLYRAAENTDHIKFCVLPVEK